MVILDAKFCIVKEIFNYDILYKAIWEERRNAISRKYWKLGSGCDAVGIAVASDTWDPQFESIHQQFYLQSAVIKNLHCKDKNKEKEAGRGQINKRNIGKIQFENDLFAILYNFKCFVCNWQTGDQS